MKVRGELPILGPAGGPFAVVSQALLAAFVVPQEEGPLKLTMAERLGPALAQGQALVTAGVAELAAQGAAFTAALPTIWNVLALGP